MESGHSRQSPRLSRADRQILAFMAEHNVVVARQVERLLGSSRESVRRRLSRLTHDEMIHPAQGFGARCWLIDPPGLDAIGSDLPAPELKHAHYKHSLGLAWLWLAAQAGAFGPVADVIGERRLRSHDEADICGVELHSVRLGGYDGHGRERRHYPDVLLVDGHGRRLALELDLNPKKVAAREEILGGYGADRRLDGVLYLVEANEPGRSIARGLRATAAQMDLLDRVHIRRISPIFPEAGGGRGVEEARQRSRIRTRRRVAVTARQAGR